MSQPAEPSRIPDINSIYYDYIRIKTADVLINSQYLEKVLKGLCVGIAPKGVRITSEDFLSGDPERTRYTLGQVSKAVQSTNIFSRDFGTRLDTYVQRRNRFVHGLYADHFQDRDEIRPNTVKGQEYENHCRWLMHEGTELIESVFGILFTFYVNLRDSGVSDPELLKLIESFEEFGELGYSALREDLRRRWQRLSVGPIDRGQTST